MDTTEELTPKTEAPSGPPPWEIAQKAASFTGHYVSEKIEQATTAIKGMLPWETAQAAAKAPPPKSPPVVDKFETVFNNMVQQESGGKHTDASGNLTTSNKGATGITQLMPATMADPGYGVTPLRNKSKEEYLRFGKDYLKAMVNEFGGDYAKALAAYNAGVGSVKNAVAKGGDKWMDFLPKKEETIPYVNKILGNSVVAKEGKADGDEKVFGERRKDIEATPQFAAKDIIATGLDTLKARNAWVDKMEAEYKQSLKGMSRAAQDKYFSNSWYYAKDKHPTEAKAYQMFHNAGVDGLKDSQRSFLEDANPSFSHPSYTGDANGFVFVDDNKRVYLNTSADMTTILHETEHVKQNRDFAAMGMDAPADRIGMLGNAGTPVAKLRQLSSEMRDDPGFKEVWRADNAHTSSREWLANLSSFMRTGIPEGKSWSDTKFFKSLTKKVGEKEAITMLLDAVSTVNRAPYTKGRMGK